jgi:hypothetical protein
LSINPLSFPCLVAAGHRTIKFLFRSDSAGRGPVQVWLQLCHSKYFRLKFCVCRFCAMLSKLYLIAELKKVTANCNSEILQSALCPLLLKAIPASWGGRISGPGKVSEILTFSKDSDSSDASLDAEPSTLLFRRKIGIGHIPERHIGEIVHSLLSLLQPYAAIELKDRQRRKLQLIKTSLYFYITRTAR